MGNKAVTDLSEAVAYVKGDLWAPIETAPRIISATKGAERILITGICEGHKWIEIGHIDAQTGTFIMSNGQTLLGARHWMPLPKMPEM